MMMIPILETKRLILRPITLADVPAVQKYFNDWDIIKHMSIAVPWPYPDDDALTHIRDDVLPKMAAGESYVWVITMGNIVSNAKDNTSSRRVKEKAGAIYLHDEIVKHHSGDIAEIWQITKESWMQANKNLR